MSSVARYSIVFPTHNRTKHICHALNSFLKLDKISDYNFELIVVANACTDSTVSDVTDILKNVDFSWKVIEEDKLGLSHARNTGVLTSVGEIIVFLDDDIEFDQNWLIGLDKSFNESDFDIIGGKISLWWKDCVEPDWFTAYERRLLGHNDHGDKIFQATPSMIFGGNFAFKRQVWQKIGEFKASFGRVGNNKGAGEEADFVMRAVDFGVSIGFSPEFEIRHLVTEDRLSFSTLIKFSIGAGRAKSQINNNKGYWVKLKKFLRSILTFFKKIS